MQSSNLFHENDIEEPVMKGKKIIIVHGYTASPEKNWFPWLKEELESLGAIVPVPAMPESNFPDPQKWQQHLLNSHIQFDEDTILIGHSLGCVTVLRFLEQQVPQGVKIGGYVLVAGFDHNLETLPSLESHTEVLLDYRKLTHIANKRISLISSNDRVVEPQASKDLACALQAEIVIEENAGHFLDREGYTEFQTLLNILKTQF